MPLINRDEILEPISPDAPSGENLEYDAEFLSLERSAQGRAEQQIGDVIVAAETPDYNAVLRHAVQLLTRSKDLRVAAHLVTALTFRDGFAGISEGLAVVHGLLEQFWSSVHPQLDPDDDDDPTMRITALAALCTPGVLSALRTAPLVRSRSFGPISLRDIANSTSDTPSVANGSKLDAAAIEAAFNEVELDNLESSIQSLKDAARHLAGIETTFDANAGTRGPELSPLAQLLRQATLTIEQRTEARRGGALPLDGAAEDVQVSSSGVVRPAAAGARLSGEISTREDVVRALDKICAYYLQHEPSSPLPMLLERCKRLVPMSFMDIVRDLAPDGLSQVERLAGNSGD
jgi:type VI secretion system protein ImpA